jgi:hypothetical protein
MVTFGGLRTMRVVAQAITYFPQNPWESRSPSPPHGWAPPRRQCDLPRLRPRSARGLLEQYSRIRREVRMDCSAE